MMNNILLKLREQKVLALLLLISLFQNHAFGQVIFSENFDGAWTSSKPTASWTGSTDDTKNWHRNDYLTSWPFSGGGSSSAAGAASTTYYARYHSYGIAAANTALMATPAINLSTYTAQTVKVSFYYINPTGTDNMVVAFSSDGTNYTNIGTLTTASAWTLQEYTLAAGYKTANFKVRFTATADYGNDDIGIDEFSVAVPCTTPTAYTVSGTGNFCAGGSGLPVGLSGSQTGVNYQLKRDGSDVGTPMTGTGSALNYGNQTVAGVYTVTAIGTGSYCSTGTNMTGSATITVNSLSTDPASISGPSSVLAGTVANLSVTGGSLGAGASWKWYTGSCGGTLVNTGSTYAPTVSGTTTYYVRAEGTCNNTACVSITVTTQSSCDVIYVDATNGNDIYSGAVGSPVKSLNRAMALVSGTRNHIKMTTGAYAETNIINLQSNVVIEGRYSVSSGVWSKSSNTASATTITMSGTETINNDVAHTVGFKSNGVSNWKLIDLNVVTGAASGQTTSGNGKSNYGVWISGTASSGYEITRCSLTSGNASDGIGRNNSTGFDGSNGSNGAVGGTGNGGSSSCGTDNPTSGASGGSGGAGGSNATRIGSGSGISGSTGGGGGTGTNDNGGGGSVGSGRTGTCSGGGGVIGASDSGNDDTPYGGNGSACTTVGTSGTAGTTQGSAYTTGFYVPSYGTNGTTGSGGGGGAGGGGGGNDESGCDSGGGGGSGGSGGGGGGGAGAGGRGGGASFGVFIWNGGTGGVITQSIVAAQTAGAGGTGGNGGNGGAGGAISAQGNTSSDGQSNRGGRGGAGSAGGVGGAGGSGSAGVQYAIANQGGGTAPTISSLSPAITLNSTTSGGSVANTTVVSLNSVPNKICQNSILNVTTSSASWGLPSGWDYVKYNNTAVTSEYTASSTTADITTTNTNGFDNLTANGLIFNSYLNVRSARTLPVITLKADDGSTLTPAATICDGKGTQLTATAWGTEVEYKWEIFNTTNAPNKGLTTGLVYSSSAQTPVSGNLTQGTYLVRYQVREECCGWSIPVFIVLTVIPAPTASMASATVALCHGNTYTLSGNVVATGAWTLNLSNGDVVTGTGNQAWTKVVTPTATSTVYTVTSVVSASGCSTAGTGSTTLTLPTAGTTLAGNNEAVTCLVNGNNYIHFYYAGGKLIGSINPNGNNLGNVTMTSYVDGSVQLVSACNSSNAAYATSVMQRHWVITPTTQPSSGNISVRLPFGDGEFTTLQAAAVANANPLDNVGTLSSLKLSKYSGPANVNNLATDNCASPVGTGSGGTTLHTQATSGAVNTTNLFVNTVPGSSFAQYDIASCSEFWLHGSSSSPLPVTLLDFSVSCKNDKAVIKWATASEQNSEKFILEKSNDLESWNVTDGVQAAGNSNYHIDYNSEDFNPHRGTSYYRLKQVDFDGAMTIYGPVSLSCSEEGNSMIVFPNPAKSSFTVEISSEKEVGQAKILLIDLTGKVISSRSTQVVKGNNQVLYDAANLQQGTYILKLVSGDNAFQPVKVVIN